MKTSSPSYAIRKAKREKLLRKMEVMRAAKERKRIESHADDEPRVEWRGRLEWTLTICNRISGTQHALDLRRGQRRDRYDATLDGKPWAQGISGTRIAAKLRKTLTTHIQ